jgi:hypothetical protein
VCDATVDPTIFSSPRIEAGGGDPIVGFTDDTLDCQTMPIEQFDYAGQGFTEVFSEDEQSALLAAFPEGVCDYSKPGKGFQAAVTWLTYQDLDGNVVYGGQPLGTPPTSVPYGPSGAPVPVGDGDPVGAPLPATGGSTLLALAGALALVSALTAARRRTPRGTV